MYNTDTCHSEETSLQLKNTLMNHLRFTIHLKSLHAAQNGLKNIPSFSFGYIREEYDQMKEEEECVLMKSQYGAVCTILCFIFWIDTTYV